VLAVALGKNICKERAIFVDVTLYYIRDIVC
jgi:hypothetical protein